MSARNSTASTPPATPTVCAPPTVPTKLCHIVKRPDFEGYGFNLHSEKIKPGQYIGKVDANSPAEAAGLKEGDRIIEVNGMAIGNEAHKQVVQRIKALNCEVRLLLVDVDGGAKAVAAAAAAGAANGKENDRSSSNKVKAVVERQQQEQQQLSTAPPQNPIAIADASNGTKQEMPGASANISSISMVSTKRTSNASNQSRSSNVDSNMPAVTMREVASAGAATANGRDVADFSAMIEGNPTTISNIRSKGSSPNDNNNINDSGTMSMKTPPPPATVMASAVHQNNNSYAAAETTTMAYKNGNSYVEEVAAVSNTTGNGSSNSNISNSNSNKSGSLQLPMTAAEMRAKLLSKKKYDPKSDSVDLKKKFEIIQKL